MTNWRGPKVLKWLAVAACLAAGAGALLAWDRQQGDTARAEAPPPRTPTLRLAADKPNTLELSSELIGSMGLRTAQVQSSTTHDHLTLSGLLDVDPNRMVRVHSRFSGEVVSIGSNAPGEAGEKGPDNLLRPGDHVAKGQLLAVVWSADIGEKKSDLVNALSRLYLDQTQAESLRKLGKDVIPARQLREAEQKQEADVIEVARLERTLRSWRLTDEEINAVRAEAEKIHRGNLTPDLSVDRSWAEVEVRSALDGIVMEKNIAAGDIVDTSLDLFKIADLSVLSVRANVYEEDLPALEALPRGECRWTVSLKSQPDAPGLCGTFDLIGNLVDPNQHTAAVFGWLDNKDLRLRAGQFITASVELPPAPGEVVIPDTALIEEGSESVVFVASDATGKEVTRRTVALASRGQGVAFMRAHPTTKEKSEGCHSLHPGEWVVVSGAILLDGALDGVLATAPTSNESAKN